jgi:hypothetical protein
LIGDTLAFAIEERRQHDTPRAVAAQIVTSW